MASTTAHRPAGSTGRDRGPDGARILLLAAAVLAVGSGVAVVAVTADPCLVNNCGYVRNEGGLPAAVSTETEPTEGSTTSVVEPADRSPVGFAWSSVRVDAGQCLEIDDGLFWSNTRTVDLTASDEGRWVPIDRWGARVTVSDDAC